MTDLPPPYTIGEANLEGTDVSRIVRYVGFTSPRPELDEERLSRARSMLDLDSRPFVFVPDQRPGRHQEQVRRHRPACDRRPLEAVQHRGLLGSPGRFASSRPASPMGRGSTNGVRSRTSSSRSRAWLVARSGHGTIGQCIDGGKPAVLIPIHNHSEQIGNAEKFSKLGLGLEIRSEDLNPERLTECRRPLHQRFRLQGQGRGADVHLKEVRGHRQVRRDNQLVQLSPVPQS